MHLAAPPPRPSALAPVPPALDAVVVRCLQKAPDQRYPTAAAVLEAVRAAAPGRAAAVTTEELREGGLNAYVHRRPTGAKYGNLVLRRGFIKGSEVGKWCRRAIEDFVFEAKDLLVSLLDEEHSPLAQWTFAGAWPLKWSLSELKAQENALAVESLELAYRMFRRG